MEIEQKAQVVLLKIRAERRYLNKPDCLILERVFLILPLPLQRQILNQVKSFIMSCCWIFIK
jgi:hypothetical protein